MLKILQYFMFVKLALIQRARRIDSSSIFNFKIRLHMRKKMYFEFFLQQAKRMGLQAKG